MTERKLYIVLCLSCSSTCGIKMKACLKENLQQSSWIDPGRKAADDSEMKTRMFVDSTVVISTGSVSV